MILTFPTIRIAQASFGLRSNTQEHRSPFSGAVQTLELPGAVWQASLTLRGLSSSECRALSAWLVQLRGRAGRFYLHDHSHPGPAGVASGVPVVSGAGQTGNQLVTSGWTPNTAGILKAGDYIQIGSELKMVVADAASNGAGAATLQIEPPIRTSPASGSLIVTAQASCVMMLADDEQTRWATRPPLRSDLTLNCVEALL